MDILACSLVFCEEGVDGLVAGGEGRRVERRMLSRVWNETPLLRLLFIYINACITSLVERARQTNSYETTLQGTKY